MDVWLTVLLSILLSLLMVVLLDVAAGALYRCCSRQCKSNVRLEGKTAIVTGSSAGIGKETALFLATRGARVILACRNLSKAQLVADGIIRESGNRNVVVRIVDLSDLESVRKFADQINEEEGSLHILINNAGMVSTGARKTSPQGLEMSMATNHYGCFLLTNLLTDKLKASAPSRVVTVSSLGYLLNELDITDLNYEHRSFNTTKAYCQSKLCNLLFTKELARRLEGTGVTANCLHPGFVASEIFNKGQTVKGKITDLIAKVNGRNTRQGAQTTNYLAVSDQVQGLSGDYYYNCRKTRVYRKANDMALASRLWATSCRDVGLPTDEPLV